MAVWSISMDSEGGVCLCSRLAATGGKSRDGYVGLSLGVRDQCGRQLVRGTTERVEHVPPLFTRGRAHRPDDGTVGRAGPAAEAAGDLLPHLFGPRALFRQVVGGRNPGVHREHQHRVPMIARTEDEIVSRASFPAAPPS